MKSTWRITALVLAIATTALAAVAGTASAAPAAGTSASATTIRIWADGNRKAAVERVAGAWARSRGVTVEVVLKEFGDIRDQPQHGHGRCGTRRHRRRARLDGRARGRRPRRSRSSPSKTAIAPIPEVHARRVLLRHRRQAALRHPGRGREHRPRREHEARQRPDDLRAAPEAGARLQEEEERQPRPRRPAGRERRRVPHVPVLLRPRRLRLRHQQGRQPRRLGHRRREQGVPGEREDDRQAGTRKA